MTIQIEDPEVEALIEERMASGRFDSVQTALHFVLTNAPRTPDHDPREPSWKDAIAAARAFGGYNLDIERGRVNNPNRDIDLS